MKYENSVVLLAPYCGEREYELCDQNLGLLYLSSVLTKSTPSFPNKIIDTRANKMNSEQATGAILSINPGILGISCTTNQFSTGVEIARRIKLSRPETVIVFGGAHVSALPKESIMLPCMDYVVQGEGEWALHNIVNHVVNKTPLKVPGIYYKDIEGQNISYKESPSDATSGGTRGLLDELPFPDFDKIEIKKYFHRQKRFAHTKNTPYLCIISSRGCPGQCVFCAHAVFGQRIRARSPENIVNEIEYNISKYNTREIRIMDDCFNFNKARVIEFCKLVIEHNLKVSFALPNGVRADRLDEEMLCWMKKAGFYMIFLGIESADQEVLNTIKKGYDLKKIEKVIKLCKKIGFYTGLFLVVGLPGSSNYSEYKTLRFVKKANPDFIGVAMCTPYPGSELYNSVNPVNNWDFYKHDFTKKGSIPLYIPARRNKEELLYWHRKMLFSFYLRFTYIFSRIKHISWISKRLFFFLNAAYRRFIKHF